MNYDYEIRQYKCSYCGNPLWISICVLTVLLIFVGNILTVLAVLVSKKLSSVRSNYFVLNLAVSDLLLGCFIPYHMLFYLKEEYGNTETECLSRFILGCFSFSSSITSLFLIALDRYIAVIYPFRYVNYITRRSVIVLIILAWLSSVGISSMQMVWNDWQDGEKCETVYVIPMDYKMFIVFPLFLCIWLIILFFYLRICREASETTKNIPVNDRKHIKLVMLILGCFTICWLPFFALAAFLRASKDYRYANLYEALLNVAFLNSSMNPVIYAWKNRKFRQAFICLLKCRSPNNLKNVNFITNYVPNRGSYVKGVCNKSYEQEDSSGN